MSRARIVITAELNPNATWDDLFDEVRAITLRSAVIIDSITSEASSLYPADWPKCPFCGEPVLDGHIICGRASCNEGAHRP